MADETEGTEKSAIEKGRDFISQFKDMEFHARQNVEKLASIQLEMEDKLKHKEFADRAGDLFSVESSFIDQIQSLCHDYDIELNRLAQEG